MNKNERKTLEKFLKNRPGREEDVIKKVLLPIKDDSLDESKWRKHLKLMLDSSKIKDLKPPARITWVANPELLSKRNCHSATVVGDKIFFIGGYYDKMIAKDAVSYDISKKTWTKIVIKQDEAKAARYAHKAVLVDSTVYIFGGYVDDIGWVNDMCRINLAHESIEEFLTMERMEASGDIPCKRAAHSMQIYADHFYVFGGNWDLQFFNDLYRFSFKGDKKWEKIKYANEFTDISNIPVARAGQSLEVYDNSLILFGGGNRTHFFGDLFSFDFTTCKWQLLSSKGVGPSPRAGHSSIKISSTQCCIFGGGDLMNVFNDCFLLDFSDLTWMRVLPASRPPTMRAGQTSSFHEGTLIIFGGGDVENNVFSDLYLADFSAYIQSPSVVKKDPIPIEKKEVSSQEKLNTLQKYIEHQHAMQQSKFDCLKGYIAVMEKEELEHYSIVKKELDDLQSVLKN